MILVTGASGFVGGALLQRLGIANPQEGIVAATRRLLENLLVDVNQVQVGICCPQLIGGLLYKVSML